MERRAVVVGAGIIGASVGLELARRGWQVRVIEKRPKAGMGSTALSSSIIHSNYAHPGAIRLAQEGRAVWESWFRHVGLPIIKTRFHPVGFLLLGEELTDLATARGTRLRESVDREGIEERFHTMTKEQVKAFVMRGSALSRQFPLLAFRESDLLGLWEPEAGYVAYPNGAVQDLQAAGEEEGVAYWLNSGVRGVQTEWVGDRPVVRKMIVETPKETVTLDCEILINCAGPESPALNIDMRCPLPLTTAPMRQFIVEGKWANPPETPLPCMVDLIEGFYMRPDRKSFKIGAVLPEHHYGFVRAPDRLVDPDEMARFEEDIVARFQRRVPGVELADVNTYVSYYDWTVADPYPIIDSTLIRGCYAAVGTSGTWFKAAPVIGRLAAELVERREMMDENTVVELPLTHSEVDLKFFSASR